MSEKLAYVITRKTNQTGCPSQCRVAIVTCHGAAHVHHEATKNVDSVLVSLSVSFPLLRKRFKSFQFNSKLPCQLYVFGHEFF